MPKAGADFSSKKFSSLNAAYNAYSRTRFRETDDPGIAPKKRFAQIWGWGAKTPGKRARVALSE